MVCLTNFLDEWWFDFSYRVDTSAEFEKQEILGWPQDKTNFHYLPTVPRRARRLLRNLPLQSREEYTFIDFGSGKGRMLFLAARHGFRRVCGIELRQALHERASDNFLRCRHMKGCTMESFLMNAADFEFPNEKSVVFFFNPFGSDVMEKVLANLGRSLDSALRDVWVVLQDPTPTYLADHTPQLRLLLSKRGFNVYRSVSGAERA